MYMLRHGPAKTRTMISCYAFKLHDSESTIVLNVLLQKPSLNRIACHGTLLYCYHAHIKA